MSSPKNPKNENTANTWALSGSWLGTWKTFAGVAALGLAGAAFGAFQDPRRFAFSWLFAFITFVTIALGAIFFVLIQHLTSAGWSVTVRRTAEFFANGILVLIPLFIPVVFMMGHLFPWLNTGHEHAAKAEHAAVELSIIGVAHAEDHEAKGEHAAPQDRAAPPAGHVAPVAGAARDALGHGLAPTGGHGAAAAAGHGVAGLPDPHHLIHAEVMQKKAAYLNKPFFLARAGIYFLIWVVLAVRLFGFSTAQDSSKDPQLTVRAQAFAPAATFLFALSLTFAVFDWVMALEPSWFSTIFGVYMFATGVVSSLALIILVTMALRKNSGPLHGAVSVEHYHDLGKLMFGFTVFWAYIGFSQFMLIWYAALPEETTWYHNRWDFAPWSSVSMLILFGHFVIPFFWTISRNFKRNLGRLQIGAAILLVMHVVDIYWFVMPNFMLGKEGFTFSWIDLACLLAVGGVYGAFVFYRMTQFSLVPVGDPRLQRSLHFQNA